MYNLKAKRSECTKHMELMQARLTALEPPN